jgi:aldehyde:ferredoxin oxidoreductase
MEHFYILEKWGSFEKVIGLCFFGPAPRSFIQPEDVLAAIKAVTGWDVTMDELLQIGERATNMARIFNTREGFSRKDDSLPERLFQPLENGALEGHAMPRDEFEQALTQLYLLKGWDPKTGSPTQKRLEELSLGWAVDKFERV